MPETKPGKKLLSGQEILAAADLSGAAAFRDVPCPEWGGHVRIAAVSSAELMDWEASRIEAVESDKAVARQTVAASLVALCARDSQGNRLFSPQQLAALAGKSARALYRLFREAQRLNGLRSEDFQELESFFQGQAPAPASS